MLFLVDLAARFVIRERDYYYLVGVNGKLNIIDDIRLFLSWVTKENIIKIAKIFHDKKDRVSKVV